MKANIKDQSKIHFFSMKRISRFLILSILFIATVSSVYAVRAYPLPVTITQPDGSTLTIKLSGDEFRKIRTTEDGYLIKQNDAGYYNIAIVDASGVITATNIRAKDVEKRNSDDVRILQSIKKPDVNTLLQKTKTSLRKAASQTLTTEIQKVYPRTGTPKSLVILVNFNDVAFTVSNPQIAFTNLLNQEGYSANGGTGSARDYFRSASFGKFNPQFDVVGPVKLNQNYAYYGANDASDNDLRPQQMVIDACLAADNNGVDFTQYDTDNDGYVDNIFIYYAGYNEAEGGSENTVWPHRWDLGNTSTKFDNKIIFDYACSSELRGSTGTNMCGIGTFTHEFGHVLDLPDYYHTDDPDKNTLDYWSIMDMGPYLNLGRTPPTYSAYDRFYLGWFTPQQVSTPSNLELLPLYQGLTPPANTDKQSYLLSATNHNLSGSNPSPKEFFMVEYRKKTGWDAFLPGEGMLIWHIDYDQTAWYNNSPNNYTGTGSTQTASSHMRVYLHPNNGTLTTPGSAFTMGSFTPKTWSGVDINRPITEIIKTTDKISFQIMGGYVEPVDPNAPNVKLGAVNDALTFTATKTGKTKSKTLNIKTTDLTGSLTLAITGSNASYFSVTPTSVTKESANSSGGFNISVTYSPSAAGDHTAVLSISGGGLTPTKVINLEGTGN